MKFQPIFAALSSALFFSTTHVYAQQSANNMQVSDTQPDELEIISVVSSKVPISLREIATTVTVVNSEAIAARGSISLADILRSEAGIAVSNSGGVGKNTTLRVRGEEGFRTKLYIDGVELSDPTAPQVTPIFDDMLSNHIQRVEILHGPQGLMYGADAGGVIILQSKTAEEGLLASANAELGSFSSRNLSGELGFGNQQGNIYLAASDYSTDGFNAQSADLEADKDGYQSTSLHLKAGLQLSSHLSAGLVLRDVESDNLYDGCYDNQTFALIYDCQTQAQNQTSRLSLNYAKDGQSHSVGIANTQVERTFLSAQELSFASEGEMSKFDYLGHFEFEQKRLIFGFDAEQEEIKSSNLHRKQKGIFAEYQQTFNQQLALSAALRHDDNDSFGSFTSYRVGAVYWLALANKQTLKLKSTFGTGFRAPSLYEQDYNDGPFAYGQAAALKLSEETSKGLDLGVEYDNTKGLSASLVFFRQTIEDEIYFDGLAFQGYLQSSGSSESEGFELAAQKQFSQQFTLWGNYTYNDAQTEQEQARLRRPAHIGNLGANLSLLHDKLNLSISIRAVNDAVDIGQEALDDYQLVNGSVRYHISKRLSLRLRVENLLDKKYQEVVGFNTPGRSVFVNVQASL